MELTGHIENGVVVFDGGTPPPEGTRVTVVTVEQVVHKKIDFPLVRSGEPGSWALTNEKIGEIFDEEDARDRPYLNDEGKIVITNEMIEDILMEEDVRAVMDQWNATSGH